MNPYEKQATELKSERRYKIDRAQLVWQAALDSDGELHDAYAEYTEDMIKAARGEASTKDVTRARYLSALNKHGLSEDMFDPPYSCEKCKDTGKVNGRYCSCVIRAVINADKDNLRLPSADFEECEKTAPSAAIKKAYAAARKYIENEELPFLVLLGEPGTGKTVLASAVSTELMKRGASAVTLTAFEFVRRSLDYHTRFANADYKDGFTPMVDCDVLTIDDLGTENMLKNVTKEYLYSVINERWLFGKRTVITTNLTPVQLNERYGESIFSRIFDKKKSVCLQIKAKNARLSD